MSLVSFGCYTTIKELREYCGANMDVDVSSEWSELIAGVTRAEMLNFHPITIPKLFFPLTPLPYLYISGEEWIRGRINIFN